MSDIFIGYSRNDFAIAEQLVQRLRREGWSVFIDQQTQVGQRWDKKIEKELHAARAVVVLWSITSRNSEFVLEEAEYGKRKEILFPVLIERVEYPYGFGRIHTAELIDWSNQTQHAGLLQLLQALQAHLHSANAEPPQSAASIQSIPFAEKAILKPGQTFRDKLQLGGEGPLMRIIPAGRFLMGSPEDEPGRGDNESPQHEVQIATPFALGVYAVTFGEYDMFCQITKRKNTHDALWGRGNRPVINVSWHDAQACCEWLSEQTQQHYRLPSEAEWEYACRAGTESSYFTGHRIAPHQANYDAKQTLPVGSFPHNAFGLYDMHGNVWEWTQDCWHDNYNNAPNDGPAWLKNSAGDCDRRVIRGGSWYGDPQFLRSAIRVKNGTDDTYDRIGFRIARVL